LLFIKGGDSNVYSYDNKRLSSWHLQDVYPSKEHYDNFIAELMMSDISGGSWQFQSLKNKSFNGYKEYENTIFNRFEKAFKNHLTLNYSVDDVNKENIYKFEDDIKNLFRQKNISLNTESGNESSLGFVWSYNKDVTAAAAAEAALKRLQQVPKLYNRKGIDNYRAFCLKYSDKKLVDIADDIEFCGAIRDMDMHHGTGVNILESISDPLITSKFKYSAFNILINSSKEDIEKLLLSYHIESLLELYPEQFETLACLSQFKIISVEILTDLKESNNYRLKNAANAFEVICTADYAVLKANQKEQIENILKGSKHNFIEAWNSLEERSWYKNTNEQLPRYISMLDKAFSTNTFSLEDVKDKCNCDISQVIKYYENQMKKNRPAIKKAFNDLMNRYTVLFDDYDIEELCEYFGYKKPTIAKESQNIQTQAEPEEINNVVVEKQQQLSLFDFMDVA